MYDGCLSRVSVSVCVTALPGRQVSGPELSDSLAAGAGVRGEDPRPAAVLPQPGRLSAPTPGQAERGRGGRRPAGGRAGDRLRLRPAAASSRDAHLSRPPVIAGHCSSVIVTGHRPLATRFNRLPARHMASRPGSLRIAQLIQDTLFCA